MDTRKDYPCLFFNIAVPLQGQEYYEINFLGSKQTGHRQHVHADPGWRL